MSKSKAEPENKRRGGRQADGRVTISSGMPISAPAEMAKEVETYLSSLPRFQRAIMLGKILHYAARQGWGITTEIPLDKPPR